MSLITAVDEDKDMKSDATIPKVVSVNGKMYTLLLLSFIVICFLVYMLNEANERAELNTELMFVKMYPNGTWDIEYRNSGNEADFFPLTIDKLINDYVIARHGVDPHNIRRDYGFALVFMSQALSTNFVGTQQGQYNAAATAKEKQEVGDYEEVSVRFVDHFDVSEGNFVHGNSDVYRTNVFIERIIKNSAGMIQGKPIKQVVNLHWRIKSVDQLRKFTRKQLRANPIGLEIIKDKITIDHSKT